jgi:hypothetical protein
MRLAFFTGLLFIPYPSLAQSLTLRQVKQQMSQLFEVAQDTADGQTYRYERVVELPASNVFSDLTKNNEQYLFYIKDNYSNIDYPVLRSSSTDLTQANQKLQLAFKQDSLYNQCATELAHYYLLTKGVRIPDYTPPRKRKVSTAELMQVAARFFYAHTVNEAPDSIGFHVCVGMNGYQHNQQLLTNPLVEAFCFMALFQNLHNPEYGYWAYFTQQVKRIRTKYRVGDNRVQRIETARQEMYGLMGANLELKRALLAEYARKEAMLNFVLID